MQSPVGNHGPSSGLHTTTLSASATSSPPPTPESPLRPGGVVPGTRFRIVEQLDEGGVGEIYRADHIDLERPVALKVLRDDPDDSEAVERFRREAALTTRISSPHVVEILDYGVLPDGRPFYAMPWLGASPLDALITRGPLPVDRAIGFLRMACKGLAAAHAAGVTHRDVKPENLMVVQTEGRERLVVVDFGIATPSGTIPEVHGGTPTYMSPEQVLGLPIDERADIYGLGCVAYEMLTGRAPFLAPTIVSLLRQHADCDPEPLSRRCKVPLPSGLEAVVLRCLEKNREDRFASMAELEAALCEVQMSSGTRTAWDDLSPPDVDEQRKSAIARALHDPRSARARRWRATAAAAAAVGLLAAVHLIPFHGSASPEASSGPVPEPRPAMQRHARQPAAPSEQAAERNGEDAAAAAISSAHAPQLEHPSSAPPPPTR